MVNEELIIPEEQQKLSGDTEQLFHNAQEEIEKD